MLVAVITPEQVLTETEGDLVIIPTSSGVIGVGDNHLPLVTVLTPGEVVIKHHKEEKSYAVSGGFVEVLPDTVYIMADSAVHAADLNEAAIQQAIARAKQAAAEAKDQSQFSSAMGALETSLAHLKIARRKKAPRHTLPPDQES